jgi:ESF2/ABP1 family protein
MGMDDAAGSASWGKRKEKKGKKEAAETVVEDIADDVDDVDDDEVDAEDTAASAPKQKKKKKTLTTGVVYISRLPPGMTPHKVRHLMARWGDVGRVYAQRRDGELTRPSAEN